MNKLIVGAIGVMILMTLGCSTMQTPAPSATPPADEKALIWFEHGNAYVQLGKYDKAVEDFTNAIAIDPNFADAYYSRGLVLGRMKKHDQAISDFTQAIKLNPRNAGVYVDRGAAFGSLGQHAQATSDFSEAIALNPDLAGAYYNRAIGYFVEKKCSEARKDVKRAQELGYQKIQPEFLTELNKSCPEN